MEREKTAVEWLEEQLIKEGIYVGEELYIQAKQMEKEQIEEAFDNGFDRCYNTRHRPYMVAEDYGKHYYESKYGKDEI